ncbi:aspartic peptidase domain-containing protein [Trametes punicea]|nr:aspartic peptidase domain-containing protein [Trametes punicea]
MMVLIPFQAGSPDLWVPSANCTSSYCSKDKYNPASSSSSARKSGKFSIEYGDGSSVSGPVYTETVAVAGVTVKGQYFSPPVCQHGKIATRGEERGLRFNLAKSGSELYLGRTDTSLYTSSIEYLAITESGFWQISGASISVVPQTAASGFQTIIDSGTTIIYGPPNAGSTFYQNINGCLKPSQAFTVRLCPFLFEVYSMHRFHLLHESVSHSVPGCSA